MLGLAVREQVGVRGYNALILSLYACQCPIYHKHCPSFIVRKPTPATARVLSFRRWAHIDKVGVGTYDLCLCLSLSEIQIWPDLFCLCLVPRISICTTLSAEYQELVLYCKCLFWLRSLITLHLNQRSQLECDWRWASQLANTEKFQNPSRDICLVYLFITDVGSLMKMSLLLVLEGGGWEGFPYFHSFALS